MKKKSKLKNAMPFFIGAAIGMTWAIVNRLTGFGALRSLSASTPTEQLLRAGTLILAVAASFLLHVFLHEAGHLIAGLMSGYSFVSFRIFTTVFVKRGGKIRTGRFTIPGTLGQCLMSPPEPVDGHFPYLLSNLGGALMNFMAAGLVVIPALLVESSFARIALFTFVFCGFFLGLINFIPIKASGLANDGYNALTLGRRDAARRAFWLALRINALLSEGQRLRDMPTEWFEMPDSADLNDVMISASATFKLSLLIDRLAFEEAKEYGEYILNTADAMLEIYKNEVRCEILFLEIIGECRKDEVARLFTDELRMYVKATMLLVARQRLNYAYVTLVSRDKAKAEKVRAQFEKACATYPNAGEVEGERELMRIIDQKAE